MKKGLLSVLATAMFFVAEAQVWSLDKEHSKLGFSATHLMISNVEGSFKAFDARITSSKPDFSDAVIELTADASSIDTDHEKRDAHLKNPDFLDVEKYNSIVFKSTSIKKKDAKTYEVNGNLTMHGNTKPVVLLATFGGVAVHPYSKKTMAGFKITAALKRTDFGIGTSIPTAMVGDEILITANTEFAKE